MLWHRQKLIGKHNELFELEHILPIDRVKVVKPLIIPFSNEGIYVQVQTSLIMNNHLSSYISSCPKSDWTVLIHSLGNNFIITGQLVQFSNNVAMLFEPLDSSGDRSLIISPQIMSPGMSFLLQSLVSV